MHDRLKYRKILKYAIVYGKYVSSVQWEKLIKLETMLGKSFCVTYTIKYVQIIKPGKYLFIMDFYESKDTES